LSFAVKKNTEIKCDADRYTAEDGGTSPAASRHHQAAFQWPWDHGGKGSSANPKEEQEKPSCKRSFLGILTF